LAAAAAALRNGSVGGMARNHRRLKKKRMAGWPKISSSAAGALRMQHICARKWRRHTRGSGSVSAAARNIARICGSLKSAAARSENLGSVETGIFGAFRGALASKTPYRAPAGGGGGEHLCRINSAHRRSSAASLAYQQNAKISAAYV